MAEVTFEPTSAYAPIREHNGNTLLGRVTTTDEQRRQALDWALERMRLAGTTQLRVKVIWTRGEPTTLDVHANVEHLAGERRYLSLGKVTEFTSSGAEVKLTPAQVMQRITDEVALIVQAGEI